MNSDIYHTRISCTVTALCKLILYSRGEAQTSRLAMDRAAAAKKAEAYSDCLAMLTAESDCNNDAKLLNAKTTPASRARIETILASYLSQGK